MPDVRIECPHCKSVNTNPVVVGESLQCSSCGNWFKPTPNELAELIEKPAPVASQVAEIRAADQVQTRAEEVRAKAENIVTFAVVFWAIGFFILAISIMVAVSNGDGIWGHLDWILTGSGLISAGFWLYLTGQIVHIRANLEK